MLDKDSQHSDNIALTSYWTRSRHTYGGEAIMHAEKEVYLPRLDSQTDTQYETYLKRARFLNAMRRTVEGLTGTVTRKEPITEFPAGMDNFIDDVTLNNQSLADYVQDLIEEKLIVGGGGTLIDHPATPEGMSVAQAERANMRPIFTFYPVESIANRRYTVINNISTLVEVVLLEEYTSSDGEVKKQWRYLILENGVYFQRIEKEDPGADEQKTEDIPVTMNNKAMDYIPFVFHRTTTKLHFIQPPLTDLTDTNIHHYQIKADHSHGLRYVALPTPYVIGVSEPESEEGKQLTLGGQSVWFIDAEGASVGMLEFTGAGLKAFQEELSKIEQQMAQMGARILAPEDGIAPGTATEALLDAKGETSLLAKITNITSTEILTCLKIATSWMNKDPEAVEFKMPVDFLPVPMSPQMLQALVQGWQSGAFSFDTLFDNLRTGEIITGNKTVEKEKAEIEADPIQKDNSGVLDDDEDGDPDAEAGEGSE